MKTLRYIQFGMLFYAFSLALHIQIANGQGFPRWIEPLYPENVQTGSKKCAGIGYIGIPEIAFFMEPAQKNNIIGSKIELSTHGMLAMNLDGLQEMINALVVDPIYKAKGRLLDLDQEDINAVGVNTVFHWSFAVGYVQSSPLTIPIEKELLLHWKDRQGVPQNQSVRIAITHYYDYNELKANFRIKDPFDVPLENGLLVATRLGPGTSAEETQDIKIEDGEVSRWHGAGLSAGHYEIRLEEPQDCSRVLLSNLIVFPDDEETDEKFDFEVQCSNTYKMTVTYDAPGFVEVVLQYFGMQIQFTEDLEDVKGFNLMEVDRSEMMEEPRFEDGSPISVPFYQISPKGKQYFFGVTQTDNMEAHEVDIIHKGGLGTFVDFYVSDDPDALNYCSFEGRNASAVYLNYSFDLIGTIDGGGEMQVDVSAGNDYVAKITQGGGTYPVRFPRIKIDQETQDRISDGEAVELLVENGRARLHFLIEPEEE